MQQHKNSPNSPLFGSGAGASQDSDCLGMAEMVRIISLLCELKRVYRWINGLIFCVYRGVFSSHNYFIGEFA